MREIISFTLRALVILGIVSMQGCFLARASWEPRRTGQKPIISQDSAIAQESSSVSSQAERQLIVPAGDSSKKVENTLITEVATISDITKRKNREELCGDPSICGEIEAQHFRSFRAHDGEVTALVVSSTGQVAYSAGHDGTVVKSEVIVGARPGPGKLGVVRNLLFASNKPVLSLALSPDGDYLAVGLNSMVVIYDLKTDRVVTQLTQVEGRFVSLAWDPLGEILLLGRLDGEVFGWSLKGGGYAGQDSLRAVEYYRGGISPIVALAFHPSGRSFFAAEREGVISFWRLLRTERDLGLRDDSAVVDREREARQRQVLSISPRKIEDMWLSSSPEQLFVGAEDGNIYRWKIRGLKSQQPIAVSGQAVFGVVGANLSLAPRSGEGASVNLIIASARDQIIRFMCSAERESETVFSNIPGEINPAKGVNLVDSTTATAAIGSRSEALAISPVLLDGANIIGLGDGSNRLWVAQKTGNLVTFDMDLFLQSPLWRSRLLKCKA